MMKTPPSAPKEVSQLLIDWSAGNKAALDQLIPLVDAELRRLAHQYMRQERPGHTLQTTALVNEAYLRLIDQRHVNWQNRAHFFGIAAQLMRRILIDHARSRRYAKRGGDAVRVSLDEAATVSQDRAAELIALDEALQNLAAIDARRSQVVELRFFGGLSIEETAEVLKISRNTAIRDWTMASISTARSARVRIMKPERWQQISTVFQAALERMPGQQSAFLDKACAGDSSLRQEVESLIAAHEQVGNFIEAPAIAVAAPLLVGEQADSVVGRTISHYRILGPLGAGGMGEVYLAQDTKLRRQVAIKLLPPYLTQNKDRLSRFEQEAHSASTLSHPNVCVVHEIGETEDGRHFITMEYVDGVTLRQHIVAPK